MTTPAAPSGLVPCYRGSVDAWECDENAHLNVRYYVAKVNEGLPFLLAEIGHPPEALEALDARPRILGQHLRFLKEARVAAPLTVFAGLAASEAGRLTLYGEVRHSLTGEVLATVLTDLALVGRSDGAPRPASPSPSAPRCAVPAHGSPRGIPAGEPPLRPDRAALADLGFIEIGRGTIGARECDERGELEVFQYSGRISDSVVNLMAHFQSEEELARRSHGVEGGALVEFRLTYHAPLRAGSLFTVHSGVRSVGRKAQRLVHLVYDETSRACSVTCEVVAVSMDLRTRRAIDLPEERRRRMEARRLRLPG